MTYIRTKINIIIFHETFFREVVGPYTAEVRKLGFRILEFISQGLGISLGGLVGIQTLVVNHYPPCPDPSLTLGLGKHMDPVFINILLQSDVYGLQVFKDEEWIGVEPIPNAFVVNIGYPLQVNISSQALLVYIYIYIYKY